MMRKSLPQACALTKEIMVPLLCLSVLCSDAGLRLWLSRRQAIGLINASARLAGGAQNSQFREASWMRGDGGGYGITGDCDDIRHMFGRRRQRGLKAIVISFIDGLAQWNSRVLECANVIGVVHQNDRPLGERKQLPSKRGLETNSSRRIVYRLFQYKRR